LSYRGVGTEERIRRAASEGPNPRSCITTEHRVDSSANESTRIASCCICSEHRIGSSAWLSTRTRRGGIGSKPSIRSVTTDCDKPSSSVGTEERVSRSTDEALWTGRYGEIWIVPTDRGVINDLGINVEVVEASHQMPVL
jgi:hypothetical protein